MNEGRSRRLGSEIQRVLAALIAREVKDPRVGNVTVTSVDVAPDMRTARVFFTPFASPHPPEEVRAGLTHAASFLRGELGRRLALRYAPRLEFVPDDSAASAARLSRLIDGAVAADRAAHEAGTGSPAAASAPEDPGERGQRR
jgi:ribosome-binding factor A